MLMEYMTSPLKKKVSALFMDEILWQFTWNANLVAGCLIVSNKITFVISLHFTIQTVHVLSPILGSLLLRKVYVKSDGQMTVTIATSNLHHDVTGGIREKLQTASNIIRISEKHSRVFVLNIMSETVAHSVCSRGVLDGNGTEILAETQEWTFSDMPLWIRHLHLQVVENTNVTSCQADAQESSHCPRCMKDIRTQLLCRIINVPFTGAQGDLISMQVCKLLKCHYDQIFTSWFFRCITQNSMKNENAIYRLQIPALLSKIFKFEKCPNMQMRWLMTSYTQPNITSSI